MAEHTAIADKVAWEVSAFTTLWRRQRWIAVLLIFGVLGFVSWSLFSAFWEADRIADLERQNEQLSATLRESERENRGLRETVAPLLARAAREFPGEEINASLKKLLERLEGDLPSNRTLASAAFTVEVVVESDEEVGAHFIDQGGYAALAVGQDALLLARSNDSFGNTIAPKEVRYRSVFQMPADREEVGLPMGRLIAAEYAQIEFSAMPENHLVLRGKAVLVLNGSLRVEFEVPPQKAVGRRILIPNIKLPISELMRK